MVHPIAAGNFKIELFVTRVDDWGGYMPLDCDDPAAVHKFCSMLPAFVFEARPVIPIDDADIDPALGLILR